jgi:glycosyltransferase involved in cell wall biosynthesis
MMRVLFLTQTHNVWGGMEQWLHNFTAWLQRNTDWDVRVGMARGRTFNDPGRYRREHPHMRPVLLDARAGTHSSRVRTVVRAIDSIQPDVVVPIGSAVAFPALARAKAKGRDVRFVVPVRGLAPQLFVNIRDYFPIVDAVVGVSRLIERYFLETTHDHERIVYVRHGSPLPPDRSREIRSSTTPLRVAFVGRLDPDPAVKRVLDLIPFARVLERLNAAVELHLYGDGPAEDELRRELAGVSLPVVFHGHVPQELLLSSEYRRLDVLLLFSAIEGSPNAVCEAMARGVVPVIARYLGAAGERFVIDDVNGYTFRVGEVETAARLVGRIARDGALLACLSAAAFDAVDDAERMHRDWLAVLERVLRQPGHRADLTALDPSQPAGRLDRFLPTSLADGLRVAFGRGFRHPDGWAEWPGTLPVAGERTDEVLRDLRRIDNDQQAAILAGL